MRMPKGAVTLKMITKARSQGRRKVSPKKGMLLAATPPHHRMVRAIALKSQMMGSRRITSGRTPRNRSIKSNSNRNLRRSLPKKRRNGRRNGARHVKKESAKN